MVWVLHSEDRQATLQLLLAGRPACLSPRDDYLSKYRAKYSMCSLSTLASFPVSEFENSLQGQTCSMEAFTALRLP